MVEGHVVEQDVSVIDADFPHPEVGHHFVQGAFFIRRLFHQRQLQIIERRTFRCPQMQPPFKQILSQDGQAP